MTGSKGGNYVLFRRHLLKGLRDGTQNQTVPLNKEGLQAIAMIAVLESLGEAEVTLESEKRAIESLESTYRTYGGGALPTKRYESLSEALDVFASIGLLDQEMMSGVRNTLKGKE